MKRQWSDLKYDQKVGFWMVMGGDYKCMLQRGNCFDLSFGETSVCCILGWDGKWYVVMRGIRFYLHPKETYKVEI